ncbi:YceK/YidQ family lipoprotein [Pseudomonas alliivorans]|nr:YceK/YidQ family lipoprotein [Pseudomonas alliivorans]
MAANKLGRWKSNCSYIPRVYSGVSLDFCALNGEPRALRGQEVRPSESLILADMVLSGVADTLVLPYTLYLQSKHGSVTASRFSD